MANKITAGTGGTFETDITGWTSWLNETGLAQGTYGAHGGTKSLTWVTDTGVSYTGIFCGADITSGKTYTASVYFTTPSAGQYRLYIQDGPTTWAEISSIVSVSANTPTLFTVGPFVATQDVTNVVFRMQRTDAGLFTNNTVAYDDAVLDEASTNIITAGDNGTFEANITGWTSWLSETSLLQDTYGVHGGTKSLSWITDTGVTYTGLYSGAPIVNGRVYQAQVWFTTPSAGDYFFTVQDGPSTWGESSAVQTIPANTPTLFSIPQFTATVDVGSVVFRMSRSGGPTYANNKVAFDDAVLSQASSPLIKTGKGIVGRL